MAARALTPALEKKVLSKARSGWSLRSISTWLKEEHGITAGITAVRNALERRGHVPSWIYLAREASDTLPEGLDALNQMEKDMDALYAPFRDTEQPWTEARTALACRVMHQRLKLNQMRLNVSRRLPGPRPKKRALEDVSNELTVLEVPPDPMMEATEIEALDNEIQLESSQIPPADENSDQNSDQNTEGDKPPPIASRFKAADELKTIAFDRSVEANIRVPVLMAMVTGTNGRGTLPNIDARPAPAAVIKFQKASDEVFESLPSDFRDILRIVDQLVTDVMKGTLTLPLDRQAVADELGQWMLVPTKPIPPGWVDTWDQQDRRAKALKLLAMSNAGLGDLLNPGTPNT